MNMLFYTPIGKEMKEALETIGKINAIEAAKDYLESMKFANQIKSPYKEFGIGAVAGTIANGIKSLFTRKSKKVPKLSESKADEKEKFENSIKVNLKDSQVVDNSNIEARDEVEETGKEKDEEK